MNRTIVATLAAISMSTFAYSSDFSPRVGEIEFFGEFNEHYKNQNCVDEINSVDAPNMMMRIQNVLAANPGAAIRIEKGQRKVRAQSKPDCEGFISRADEFEFLLDQ